MPEQPDKPPILKFSDELLSVFSRWFEESDLDEMEMAEAAVAVINSFCGDGAIEFDADPDMLDTIDEEKE